MNLDCIIVDDDSATQVAMSALVNKSSRLNLVGVADNGEEALKLIDRSDVDLVFLDVSMPVMDGFEFLDQLESRRNLKVILVTADKEYAFKAFEYNITDYLLKPVSWHRFTEAVDRVFGTVSRDLQNGKATSYLLLKLIRYLYSRSIEVLVPVSTRDSLIGYSFPFLMENLDFNHHAHALDILEEAEKHDIFSGSFVDVVYLCNSCSNSYLNIRESCPKCGSANLESKELIHHFSCAYVGPEEEFKTGDAENALVCPKCSHKLKHIGVDYDKPSSLFNCKSCDNLFQNPLLKAKCNHCGADNHVEHLERRVIKEYTMTAHGKELAQGNVYFKKRQMQEEPSTGLEQNTVYFQRVVRSEINRKSKAEFESSLGMMILLNIEKLYEQVGQKGKRKLMAELFDLVSKTLSASDEVTFKDFETLLILFPEHSLSTAGKKLEALEKRIQELIRDNFDGFVLDAEHALIPVSEGVGYEEHINELLGKVNQTKA